MKRKTVLLVTVLGTVLLLALAVGLIRAQGATAQGGRGIRPDTMVSSAFTYQGQLKRDGHPITDTCDVELKLYDAESAGNQVGSTQSRSDISMANGLFTIPDLDFGPDAFTGEARWLEIAVRCSADASFTTLSPRQALTATPYALSLRPGAVISGTVASGNGLTVINSDTDSFTSGIWGQSESYLGRGVSGYANAAYGITAGVYGWAASTSGSGVAGHAAASSGTTYGVSGRSDSDAGYGVYGIATASSGTTYGVYGQSYANAGYGVYGTAPTIGAAGVATGMRSTGVYGAGSSYGVFGQATASAGDAHGVYGVAVSASGFGVYGYAAASSGTTHGVHGRSISTSGYGVYGVAAAASGTTHGVYGQADSTESATGVEGYTSASRGYNTGVYGHSESTSGYGVRGWADAGSGTNYGVWGRSDSSTGYGVYGHAASLLGANFGVYGRGDAIEGTGVYGYAPFYTGTNYGVYGRSESNEGRAVAGHATNEYGTTYGVLGRADSTTGYGVYSVGNFAATGTKAAIVQTKDYAWRHLYAMESPQVLFEDVGTAQLADGKAVVPIEPIFAQAVNLAEPYQVFLTPLGQEAVLLFVSEQTGTSFTVQGVTLAGQPAACSFHYRIIASRLGYERTRLAPAEDPTQIEWAAEPGAR